MNDSYYLKKILKLVKIVSKKTKKLDREQAGVDQIVKTMNEIERILKIVLVEAERGEK